MRPGTVLAAGIGAAALAGAAAVAILVLFDRPGPAASAPVAPEPAQAVSPTPLAWPAVYVTSLATTAQPEPAAQPAIRGTRLARATSGWEDVPVASRENQLGPVAPLVRAALEAARDEMNSCFDEEDARQKQRSARAPRPEPIARGPGVLVLRLESRQDGLDVVGTEVESLGTASAELAACARHVLSGWPVDARGASPGLRYRVKFVLQ